MAHQLTIREDGIVEAAFAGARPWHGLGTQVEKHMSPQEALKLAHMDWTVRLRPLWVRSMEDRPAAQIDDKVAVCRADNGRYLGTVGTSYRPLQNAEQAEFLEALTGEGGVVECVGSLFEGRRTFWTVKVPGDLLIREDDRVEQYLILANAHDGSLAFRAFWSPIRVVCNNTLNAALGRGSAVNGVSIKHTLNVKRRVDEARNVLGLAVQYGRQAAAAFTAFAGHALTKESYAAILTEVFGDEKAPDATPATVARVLGVKRTVSANLRAEVKPGQAATLWDAYNSVTYFTSHQMTRRTTSRLRDEDERRFESVLLGNGRAVQQSAFDACRKALAVN